MSKFSFSKGGYRNFFPLQPVLFWFSCDWQCHWSPSIYNEALETCTEFLIASQRNQHLQFSSLHLALKMQFILTHQYKKIKSLTLWNKLGQLILWKNYCTVSFSAYKVVIEFLFWRKSLYFLNMKCIGVHELA